MRVAAIENDCGAWRKLRLVISCLVCTATAVPLMGQAPPTIGTVGYELPPVIVSPGQIITLFVDGLAEAGQAHADKLPLPTELAGIRVLVDTRDAPRVPAPILSLEWAPAWDRTAVTVQIPYEIPAFSSPQLPSSTSLVVSRNGVESTPVVAYTVESAPRVVRRCEYTFYGHRFVCRAMITHADGSVVTARQPAKPGEVLVMYALGLGRTIPPAQTGAAPAEPLAVEIPVWLYFDFSANAASKPQGYVPAVRPLYVGAVAGFAGLYQINFRVPPIPPGTPLCGGDYIHTNLTVTVVAVTYDGAGICVEP